MGEFLHTFASHAASLADAERAIRAKDDDLRVCAAVGEVLLDRCARLEREKEHLQEQLRLSSLTKKFGAGADLDHQPGLADPGDVEGSKITGREEGPSAFALKGSTEKEHKEWEEIIARQGQRITALTQLNEDQYRRLQHNEHLTSALLEAELVIGKQMEEMAGLRRTLSRQTREIEVLQMTGPTKQSSEGEEEGEGEFASRSSSGRRSKSRRNSIKKQQQHHHHQATSSRSEDMQRAQEVVQLRFELDRAHIDLGKAQAELDVLRGELGRAQAQVEEHRYIKSALDASEMTVCYLNSEHGKLKRVIQTQWQQLQLERHLKAELVEELNKFKLGIFGASDKDEFELQSQYDDQQEDGHASLDGRVITTGTSPASISNRSSVSNSKASSRAATRTQSELEPAETTLIVQGLHRKTSGGGGGGGSGVTVVATESIAVNSSPLGAFGLRSWPLTTAAFLGGPPTPTPTTPPTTTTATRRYNHNTDPIHAMEGSRSNRSSSGSAADELTATTHSNSNNTTAPNNNNNSNSNTTTHNSSQLTTSPFLTRRQRLSLLSGGVKLSPQHLLGRFLNEASAGTGLKVVLPPILAEAARVKMAAKASASAVARRSRAPRLLETAALLSDTLPQKQRRNTLPAQLTVPEPSSPSLRTPATPTPKFILSDSPSNITIHPAPIPLSRSPNMSSPARPYPSPANSLPKSKKKAKSSQPVATSVTESVGQALAVALLRGVPKPPPQKR